MLSNSRINQADEITTMVKYNLKQASITLMSFWINWSDCLISFDTHDFGQAAHSLIHAFIEVEQHSIGFLNINTVQIRALSALHKQHPRGNMVDNHT